jgi:ABC-2 type transport system permease protein
MSARQAIVLVARRELRERLRSRTLLYGTLLLLLVIGASTALGGFFAPEKAYDVAVTAPAPDGLEAALRRAAKPFDASVEVEVLPTAAAARERLEAEGVDAVLLLESDRILFRADVDQELAAVADAAVRAVRRHLPPAPELTPTSLEAASSEPSDAEVVVALFGAMLLLGSLAIYGEWVTVGVVEEKSNRVVELILAAVRPRHLLAGKVIGIGLVGLVQLSLFAGLTAVLIVTGAFDAPAELGGSVALVIPWFALGYALYAVAFAAAGALASRQQDASAAAQPVTVTLLVTYLVGYAALTADPDGLVAVLLTVFPVTAPLVLPARDALVSVPLWQHLLAVALTLGSIYALVRFAGRVYAHGLLHTGPRLDPRAAWRLARQP